MISLYLKLYSKFFSSTWAGLRFTFLIPVDWIMYVISDLTGIISTTTEESLKQYFWICSWVILVVRAEISFDVSQIQAGMTKRAIRCKNILRGNSAWSNRAPHAMGCCFRTSYPVEGLSPTSRSFEVHWNGVLLSKSSRFDLSIALGKRNRDFQLMLLEVYAPCRYQ